jgi:hypothetical protein
VNKREQARAEKLTAKWNAEVLAEHAKLRADILARRPAWDAAVLAEVGQSYGTAPNGLPGLRDLLDSVVAADALDAVLRGGR